MLSKSFQKLLWKQISKSIVSYISEKLRGSPDKGNYMSKTEQMRRAILVVRLALISILIISIVIVIATVASGEGSKGKDVIVAAKSIKTEMLTDSQMWFLGIVGSVFSFVGLTLIKHETDIVKLKTSSTLVDAEFKHGVERFERIENSLSDISATIEDKDDIGRKRHNELKELILNRK